MKAIMYHYVRPESADFPFFRHLHIEDFRRQLEHFARNEGFVSKEAFFEALEGGDLPKGVVLTFDDGFADHCRHVLPELLDRGLWGIFYVPTGPYETGRILDVHRVHLLLGRHGAEAVAARLQAMVESWMLMEDRVAEFEETTYRHQVNARPELYVKRMLNYFLRPELKGEVIDRLMEIFFPEGEEALFHEVYMTPAELKALHEAGMLIGSHTRSHPVMSVLPAEAQAEEIDGSFACLEGMLGPLKPRTFCYPYGGRSTFTDETERLLTERGVRFSFAVEPRDITRDDLHNRPQALPRYDCNMFPHGQCRTVNLQEHIDGR